MTMKIGISIYSIPNQSIDVLIDFAERNNFDAIELWSESLPKDNVRLKMFMDRKKRELSIHGPLLDLGIKEQSDTNKSKLNETIELAGHLKAKTVVIHLGIVEKRKIGIGLGNAKDVIEYNLDSLRDYGIILSIENVGYLGKDLINDFRELSCFVDTFPKALVGVAFDIAHANITQGALVGLEILKDRVKHIHIADNNGFPEDHHKPIGKGNIDFGSIVKILNAKDVTSILEITPNASWQENLIDGRRLLEMMQS